MRYDWIDKELQARAKTALLAGDNTLKIYYQNDHRPADNLKRFARISIVNGVPKSALGANSLNEFTGLLLVDIYDELNKPEQVPVLKRLANSVLSDFPKGTRISDGGDAIVYGIGYVEQRQNGEFYHMAIAIPFDAFMENAPL